MLREDFRTVYGANITGVVMVTMDFGIMKFLQESTFSSVTRVLQKQLFNALVVQTAIPVVVTFIPCIFTWFSPMLGINFGRFNNYYTVPMFSSFPLCDPLAIIFFVADFRKTLFRTVSLFNNLLTSFCCFDILYSIMDFMAGMTSLAAGAFITRCAFIGLSYGVLQLHFIYRYVVLCKPTLEHFFAEPLYIFCSFMLVLSHGISWELGVWFLYDLPQTRELLREDFREIYQTDVSEVVMSTMDLGSILGSTVLKSWGCLATTAFPSVVAVVTYIVLGYKITTHLEKSTISTAARKLQRQLFIALVVQTTVPVVITLFPCFFTWFTPFMGINIGRFNNYYTVPLFSSFPLCDALAVIFIVSDFRKIFFRAFRKRNENSIASSTEAQTVTVRKRTV
ncbi:unnamed protein product [Caenorhabditis auriculariae]|uniref:G protein-coupled receptor n=1 Tax=Caenorhabditis auriculariae TaxID=2777116 RepID=A0A8S1H8H9_9PELO|nr:unnamed protein product [Caenorhabditis auriculariae]